MSLKSLFGVSVCFQLQGKGLGTEAGDEIHPQQSTALRGCKRAFFSFFFFLLKNDINAIVLKEIKEQGWR